jgi:hypothetical protein
MTGSRDRRERRISEPFLHLVHVLMSSTLIHIGIESPLFKVHHTSPSAPT